MKEASGVLKPRWVRTTHHIAIQAGHGLQRDAVGIEDVWRDELQNDLKCTAVGLESREVTGNPLRRGPRSDFDGAILGSDG
jgi:hypothetical protein